MTTFSNRLFSAVVLGRALMASAEPDAGFAPGQLDGELIRRVIHQHRASTYRCYEAALAKHEAITGHLVVEWDIVASGLVEHVKQAASSNLSNAQVSACVLEEIGTWRFPRPTGGRVHIAYPFVVDFTGD